MRQLALVLALILLPRVVCADLVLLPEVGTVGHSSFFATGPVGFGSSAGQNVVLTDKTGSVVLNDTATTLSLLGLSFTRPAHTIDFTVDTVQIHIAVDEMSFSLPDQHLAVTNNLNTSLATTGFSNLQWQNVGNHSGSYTLTGFNGTKVNGTFNFANNYAGPMGVNWTVTSRSGNPLIGEVTGLRGFVGAAVDSGGLIYSGNIDGIDIAFSNNGMSNAFYFNSNVSAVPEPSLGLLPLLGLIFVRRRLSV